MKFIPILFSTPMVQATLDGIKKQTRRTKGLEFINESFSSWQYLGLDELGHLMKNERGATNAIKCPYGQVGDILWVRESCFWDGDTKFTDISPIGIWRYKADNTGFSPKWRPSIHMPKEACRIFLQVTNVRVEKLQDISEEDAKAEGVDNWTYKDFATPQNWMDYRDKYSPPLLSAYDSFCSLWDSINGEQSWNDNPFVWVIEFKRIKKPLNFN